MKTITEEEYMDQLRSYIVDQMQLLAEEDKPKGLKANIEFNQNKADEFDALLISQGITIE